MWTNPHFPMVILTFTKEITNGKLYFLCSVNGIYHRWFLNITEPCLLCLGDESSEKLKNIIVSSVDKYV